MFKFFRKKSDGLSKAITEGAEIVDVRTPREFSEGHIEGAVNVPLDSIKSNVHEFLTKNKAVITCCKSGMRSASAAITLKKMGIEAYNGGGWKNLEKKIESIRSIK